MWRRAYDSAVTWTDSARAVDPTYFFAWMTLGEVEVERGNFARASAAYAAAARLTTEVDRVSAMAGSAMVEARAGRPAAASTIMRQVDSLANAFSPLSVHSAVYIAHTYAALHDADRAMYWLERFTPGADLHFQLHLRCDPAFDPIAGDRRFRALLLRQRPPAREGCR